MRRRIMLIGGAVLVVAVAVVGTLGLGGTGERDEPGAQTLPTAVPVTRSTLVSSTSVDGNLDYGTETPLAMKADGTVTWLPKEGIVVGRGEPLLRVDDRPVSLLFGELPAYRDLAEAPPPAAPDQPAPPPFTGRDVEQLEANLAALGYRGITVDRVFTAQTTAAVKRWQKDLGVPQTGAVAMTDVFFASGPVRVAKALVRPGASATGDLLAVTGVTRSVRLTLPVKQAAWAAPGTQVSVTLPDGGKVPATVSGSVDAPAPAGPDNAAGGPQQPPAVQVRVEIADQGPLGRLEHAAVTVTHVAAERKDVLSVPVAALLALAEGGYGLEVVDATSSRIVAVHTGLFADGRVEVSGPGVAEGSTVRVVQ